MNTGVQRSSATPPAARTATTAAVGRQPGNAFGQGKFVPAIALAHEIPYVGHRHGRRPARPGAQDHQGDWIGGARYVHVLVPCPLGWGTPAHDTIRMARLAQQTACSRCSRPRAARSPHRPRSAAGCRSWPTCGRRSASRTCSASSACPPRRSPASGDRRPQHRRYDLLDEDAAPAGGPVARCTPRRGHRRPVARRRRRAARGWRQPSVTVQRRTGDAPTRPPADPVAEAALMDKPFAITLDPGSSRAKPHRRLAHAAPRSTATGCAVQRSLPAGARTFRAGCSTPRAAIPAGLAHLVRDNPFPAVMGRVLLSRLRTRLQSRPARRRGGHQRGRALPRRRGDPQRLGARVARHRQRQEGAGGRRRPLGAVGRLPPGAHGPPGRGARGRPGGGGMMRFGIPKYRLPRAVLDAEVARIVALGVRIRYGCKVTDLRPRSPKAASTRRSSRSVRTSPGARSSRPATRCTCSTRCRCCARWKARPPPLLRPARGGLTAAATPRSTPRAPRGGWARSRR